MNPLNKQTKNSNYTLSLWKRMELQQPDLVHTLKTENWKNFIKVAFITHIIKQSCTYHCL
jgi:hypothetical protein